MLLAAVLVILLLAVALPLTCVAALQAVKVPQQTRHQRQGRQPSHGAFQPAPLALPRRRSLAQRGRLTKSSATVGSKALSSKAFEQPTRSSPPGRVRVEEVPFQDLKALSLFYVMSNWGAQGRLRELQVAELDKYVYNGLIELIGPNRIVQDGVVLAAKDPRTNALLGCVNMELMKAKKGTRLRSEIDSGKLSAAAATATAAKDGSSSGASQAPNVAVISGLVVAPQARRQGIGQKLCRECEKVAARWGLTSVYLFVDQVNTPAIQLYERLGYRSLFVEKQPRKEPSRFGGTQQVERAAVCMTRDLDDKTLLMAKLPGVIAEPMEWLTSALS
ncbi:unnamed protein product [Vitrella brassicaformis CCMP3155]|uniref:N-acetyltransferase domain-containing protein n=2 Tax=Vitrella brassicaformis TaxID=1169539 RepID=A0A0G4F0R9_VITBC|nr:unnamed protein product [Vitrella brassicaformis CCMP3155]|eukprot:CEM05447.1 unnamed protein product [Vitrella brassicaformis CCMP3155]